MDCCDCEGCVREHTQHDTVADEEDGEARIYAWWCGRGGAYEGPDRQGILTHAYATQLKPSKPLDDGMRIRLIALAKDKPPKRKADLEEYGPYEPHVVGRIRRIEEIRNGWVRAHILNECGGNGVKIVEIDMPHATDITVRGSRLRKFCEQKEWIGGTPDGQLAQTNSLGGTGLCMGSECCLSRAKGVIGKVIRLAMDSKEGRDEEDTRIDVGGTMMVHTWLKSY